MARPRPATFDKKKIVAENRRARFDYFLEDNIEAGIQLLGTEIKALRDGRANIAESYAAVEGREIVLINGLTDIGIGVPIANRHHLASENLIGTFVNTLVFRTDLDGNPDFLTVLSRVRTVSLEAFSHQDMPFEVLVRAGRDAPTAKLILVPEAWGGDPDTPDAHKAMYSYLASVMEPWDGPAALAMTDGRWAVAGMDRNALRPLRYTLTADNLLVVGSESGMVLLPEASIRKKGRLGPGQMIAVDGGQHLAWKTPDVLGVE